MPYYTGDAFHYRGDYYRGDYYRGDPGLFSFIGKALGGVAKIGVNVVRSQLGLSAPAPQFPGAGQLPVGIGLGYGFGVQGPQAGLVNIGGQGPQTGLINIGGSGGLPGAVMRGYHLNKSTYETRGGGTSRWPHSLQLHVKGTVPVRNRRMNPGNGKALRHAVGRVSAFGRIVHRVKRAVGRANTAVGNVHRRAKARGKR